MNDKRKPAGMSSGDWIEALIRQAEFEGKFDGVANAPDPMAGVDPASPDDEDWWLKKLIKRENLTVMPEMLALKKDIGELRGALHLVPSEAELRARVAALNARVAEVNLTNTSPVACDVVALDVERVAVAWREARAEHGLRWP